MLMMFNGVAVLNNERFLERCESRDVLPLQHSACAIALHCTGPCTAPCNAPCTAPCVFLC